MSKVSISGQWVDKMAFRTDLDGHKLIMDANVETGGSDIGPRPKVLLLAGLLGCTGIDVVSILNKMRVKVDDFNIEVSSDVTEDHPKVYENIHLIYKFKGKDLPMESLEKAVTLSKERYCGVSAMLGKSASMSYEIIVEE